MHDPNVPDRDQYFRLDHPALDDKQGRDRIEEPGHVSHRAVIRVTRQIFPALGESLLDCAQVSTDVLNLAIGRILDTQQCEVEGRVEQRVVSTWSAIGLAG